MPDSNTTDEWRPLAPLPAASGDFHNADETCLSRLPTTVELQAASAIKFHAAKIQTPKCKAGN
jgi:hypothetical protein